MADGDGFRQSPGPQEKAEEVGEVQEEVLHESVLKIGGDRFLKEPLRLLGWSQIFEKAGRGEPSAELDERFAELLVQSLQAVEPEERLLWRSKRHEAVDLDALGEDDEARVLGRDEREALLDSAQAFGRIVIEQKVGKLRERGTHQKC